MALDRLAYRIGERGDRPHVRGDPGQALVRQLEPVEQPGVEPGLLARLHVARVRLQDLVGALEQRIRHRLERRVLGRAVERRELARRRFRPRAELRYRLGGGSHADRVSVQA
jgi:transposase